MLLKDFKRLILLLGPVLFLFYLLSVYIRDEDVSRGEAAPVDSGFDSSNVPQLYLNPDYWVVYQGDIRNAESDGQTPQQVAPLLDNQSPGQEVLIDGGPQDHKELFSSSTPSRRFFSIDFGVYNVINPNIIPFPNAPDVWTVVAQENRDELMFEVRELFCDAAFFGDTLRCISPVFALPIAPTEGGKCEEDLTFLNLNVGPHDARVFLGPDKSYAVFGSNSRFTCFGLFMQDFQILAGWRRPSFILDDFITATELQRPPPWGKVEKNWFIFWDQVGQMYIHHDIHPKRAFAQLSPDGSVGPDLAPQVADSDERCMSKYMPHVASESESIHQATNSLKVTMCRSTDPACVPSEANTFIMTIYQHKGAYNFHPVYEPYVMLFQPKEPFRIHALSKRPLWIHGRQWTPEISAWEMFYITSISWANPQRKYHGFLDDEIFIAFGIEDERAGIIDVSVSDLVEDLGLCD